MIDCPKCRYLLETHWAFCPLCGQQVGAAASFDDHPIRQIVSRMQNRDAKPGGASNSEVFSGSYGPGVRAQVFEVVVRQAIAGAPWQEICAGPMQVNGISTEEIEAEVRRRGGGDSGLNGAAVPKQPIPPQGSGAVALPVPTVRERLVRSRSILLAAVEQCADDKFMRSLFNTILADVQAVLETVEKQESSSSAQQSESTLNQDLERELNRSRPILRPGEDKGPHHIEW